MRWFTIRPRSHAPSVFGVAGLLIASEASHLAPSSARPLWTLFTPAKCPAEDSVSDYVFDFLTFTADGR
jgi:hypothetical protein